MRGKINTYNNQVGGQTPMFTRYNSSDELIVLKPSTEREINFYQNIYPKLTKLQKYIPKFFGVEDIDKAKLLEMSNKAYGLIKLENLTCQYSKPCILDLKMGIRQHGHDATIEKIKSMTVKCNTTTSSSLGFRFCGMEVFNNITKQSEKWDKYYGREIKDYQVIDNLITFFNTGNKIHYQTIEKLIVELNELKSIFMSDEISKYRFWSCSLLIIYDATNDNKNFDIRLIDYAHTCHIDEIDKSENITGVDDGMIKGLTNLINRMKTIIKK